MRGVREHKEALVEEYIAEAEHQDGPEYWDQFEDLNDLLADFDLYAMAAEDSDEE
jgi:hypothetical protein